MIGMIITAFPIIETIANDITEYTATIATIANSRGIYCAIETIANDITEYTAIILFIYFYSFYILYSLFYCLLSILPYHNGYFLSISFILNYIYFIIGHLHYVLSLGAIYFTFIQLIFLIINYLYFYLL